MDHPMDPVHGPPHGPSLAERVFRRMHVETMEEGEITHCFLNFGYVPLLIYSNIFEVDIFYFLLCQYGCQRLFTLC